MSEGELITERSAVEELAPEWDALAVAASNPVAAPAWVLSWWRHVGGSDVQARVVAVRERGDLIGVAPFYLASTRRGVAEHRLMASDFGVCMEPLALPGREWEVAGAIAQVLSGCRPRPGVVGFGPMASASHWTTALGSCWEGPVRALVRTYRLEGAPVVLLREPSYDAWFASLSSKMRRELRRSERLFEQAGGTTRWSTAETLRADAEAFARLHGQRWQARGWSRLSDLGERLPDWLEDLGRGLLEDGRFGMCVLEVEGVPICVDFHLSAGTELAAVNVGWDESHAKLAPAKLAVLRVVRRAYERGIGRVSLGNGEHSNKVRLGNGNDPVAWTLVIPPSPRLPQAYAQALPSLLRMHTRELARRTLPQSWVQRLKRLRG